MIGAATLLLDLGNTRLKAAFLRAGQPYAIARFPLQDDALETAFAAWLVRCADGEATRDLTAVANLPRACLAAVAPDAVIARIMLMLQAHRIQTRRVTTQAHALGLSIAYENPARLGVDRWLNLVAARHRLAGPALVASVGTALTVDALLADGRHLGGLIAASPELSRAALVARVPHLEVPRGRVLRFAANTQDAIESGAVLAASALIEHSLHELERHAGSPATLLLTGGGAAPLRPWLPTHQAVDDLVLHGLAAWAGAQGR